MTAAATAVEQAAFPVTWADPADAARTWRWDSMHFPRPLSPLFQSAFGEVYPLSFTTALRELGAPLDRFLVMFQNGYLYDAMAPIEPATPEEGTALEERAEVGLRREMGRLRERWEREHRPTTEAFAARVRAMDVEGATPREMVRLLQEWRAGFLELWLAHFRTVLPMLPTISIFNDLHQDLFGGDPFEANALLVGQRSKSIEAGIGLSDLAQAARAAGLPRRLLETPAEAVMAALAATPEGRAYAAQLRDYLERFGLRQDLFDFLEPTWLEHPAYAIATVQAYLQSGHDARDEHEGTTRNAEALIAAARARLASYPEPVREQFEGLLQAAREAAYLQEEHNYYIDQQGMALTRLFFLRVGQRLVEAGVLGRPDDVFFLSVDEVIGLAGDPHAPRRADEARRSVAERRVAMERAKGLHPPPFLGVPPAGPPPDGNPVERAVLRFWGAPPAPAEAENELRGNAGSAGLTTGTARVALTLEEARALQPGEILVTTTTMPAWTPLFGTAAAVVTETGGSLSHCAIVAREYGIPAVVGAVGATRAIRTGQTITVDGSRGIVTLAS